MGISGRRRGWRSNPLHPHHPKPQPLSLSLSLSALLSLSFSLRFSLVLVLILVLVLGVDRILELGWVGEEGGRRRTPDKIPRNFQLRRDIMRAFLMGSAHKLHGVLK